MTIVRGTPTFPRTRGLFLSILTVSGVDHSRMRRFLSHTFSIMTPKEQVASIERKLETFFNGFKE